MNRKGILKETLGDHSESINCMALSEDGSILITGSEDLTARMWEVGVDETKCMGVLRWVTKALAYSMFLLLYTNSTISSIISGVIPATLAVSLFITSML